MLLPSALPCDAPHNARAPRFSTAALFASPPVSPPLTSQSKFTNIYSTCRALQSLLSSPPPQQLSSPPLEHLDAPMTPQNPRLRLRSRKTPPTTGDSDFHSTPRMRITKRQAPPRGLNKRRRALDEREEDSYISETETASDDAAYSFAAAPTTPKRMRLAPVILPRGLERADFQSLHASANPDEPTDESLHHDNDRDDHDWSSEDDRILVELVLEKLKLSKSDWQDCARSLGRDSSSIGKRWKSLMVNGEVGLKRGTRSRARLHGTWR